MATFRYKARDKTGAAFIATIEAEDSRVVAELLRKQGLQIITLEQPKETASSFFDALLQKIKRASRPDEVVLITRQLALMVRSGLPLVDGIEAIAEQDVSPDLRKILVSLSEDLRAGRAFSEALQRFPAFFPAFYVSMVRSGEAAGILEEILERLATIGEDEMELKGRVRAALAYPALLIILSVSIVTFLLINVLPRFFQIFQEAGASLPLPTKVLLGISYLLRTFWFMIPIGLVLGVRWFVLTSAKPEGRYRLHAFLLRAPFVGRLILQTILARSFQIMASLLKSGIAVVPALNVLEDLVGNLVVSRTISRIREAVIGGAALSEPFRSEKIFPPAVGQLISVGEKTGTLDVTFRHLGDYYEREVDRSLRTLTSVLEPLLLLGVGTIVAFIALSVLLPIFQLIKVFRR